MAAASFTPLAAAADSAAPIVLAADASIRLDTGYTRTLRQGSRWQPVGRVAQGLVLRPLDGGVLTVEGSHQHEAYLVLSDASSVVGFYLPAERAFVALSKTIALQGHSTGGAKK
jgi:hypothetical protein